MEDFQRDALIYQSRVYQGTSVESIEFLKQEKVSLFPPHTTYKHYIYLNPPPPQFILQSKWDIVKLNLMVLDIDC
jgi:hypothetical protein